MKTIRIFLLTFVLLVMISSSVGAYNSLKMMNSTGKTIYSVFLVPSNSNSWKSDRLRGTWSNGNTLTLGTSGARYWDLKIRFENRNTTIFTSIDTNNVYMLTIARKNGGGYRVFYNH